MVLTDEDDPATSARYLQPGEKLLRFSPHVGIKKFYFNAYITDRRIFLIDRGEKKIGMISKEIPRDLVTGSHLESPASGDPILVLTVRTTEDDVRTMKITFVQEGRDRSPEIEEWISLLHGRPIRPAKSVLRHREPSSYPYKEDAERPIPGHHEQVRVEERDTAPAAAPQAVVPDKTLPEQKKGSSITSPADSRSEPLPHPDPASVSFCHHCGRKIPVGANYCPYCGTRIHHPGNS